MKIKIQLAMFAFIYCNCVKGLTGINSNLTNNYFSKTEKLKSSFNSGALPINSSAFTENKGQVLGFDGIPHLGVKFVFKQANTQLFLLEKGIAYQFTRTHFPKGYTELISKRDDVEDLKKLDLQKQIRTETFRMDMMLVGANANAELTSEGKSEDYINYYNRNVLDVHNYTKITYHEIYPGIDWVIYTKKGQVKYDFVVKPGADPSLIQMQFEHQENLSLNKDGSLTLKNALGSITENKPVSYQQNKIIASKFKLTGNIVSFELSHYKHDQDFVIDPTVIWATYYGDTDPDQGLACTADASGNIYLAGTTVSSANIASGGHQNFFGGDKDAFLAKFSSSGVRLWATYYGGAGEDYGTSCVSDGTGYVYMAGYTSSNSGTVIATSGGHQPIHAGSAPFDAFLVKFDNNGVRQWGTYYGSTAYDKALSCTVDVSGNVYLAGWTVDTGTGPGSTAIATPGSHQPNGSLAYDAFLVKFNSAGVRQWGTYYGAAGVEFGASCAADASGNIYLAGYTVLAAGDGTVIATIGSHQPFGGGGSTDAFLAKFNSSGVRQWGTYYGGSEAETGYSCATDAAGNVYLTGITSTSVGTAIATSGSHQQTFGGAPYDAYLVKFNSSGVRQWGTYYGEAGDDEGSYCMTDATGNVYFGGYTNSTLNIASGGTQNTYGGGTYDAFMVKCNSNGVRQWATYYGGSNEDIGNCGTLDASGNIYLAGTTQSSAGIASGGYQNILSGNSDAFLVKFCNQEPAQPPVVSGNTLICQGSSQIYSVIPVSSATSYTWSVPSGWSGSSSNNTITITVTSSGVLSVSASNSCGLSAAQTLSITSDPMPTIVVNSGTICAGESFSISPAGAATYTITGGNNVVSPLSNSDYSVTGTSSTGCLSSNTAVANVIVDKCTSVKEIQWQENTIEVFPNPNTGTFEIRSATPVSIALYNQLGQCVWENNNAENTKSVIVHGLTKGIYLAHIVSEFGSSVKKIVVVSE